MTATTALRGAEIHSPVGQLTIVANERALVAVLWPNDDPDRVKIAFETTPVSASHVLRDTEVQLGQYFSGSRSTFELELEPTGTEFQRAVWDGLLTIPYGETRSYGQLASAIGKPSAARAVGTANGKNPLSIVVPCHRVIGGDGSLAGFAGGLGTKQRLLDLESGVEAA